MGTHSQLIVPGRYDQIRGICQFVVEGAQQAGLNEDAIFQVELACDEACTNAIEHAYGGEDKGELIILWSYDQKAFTITLFDQGQTFDPQSVPQPNLPLADEPADLKVGGLGVYFMRKLMDKIEYQLDADKGNKLIMSKFLAEEPQ